MSTPHLPQRKFSQQELEEAFRQMRVERQQEQLEAGLAADYLSERLGAVVSVAYGDPWGHAGWGGGSPSPYPDQYRLVVTYETYGPYKGSLIDQLRAMPAVTILPGAAQSDYHDAFELELSKVPELQGLGLTAIKGRFEYFDNHCTGY